MARQIVKRINKPRLITANTQQGNNDIELFWTRQGELEAELSAKHQRFNIWNDRGKIRGEQDHVHFNDGSALNKDGTWKHGKIRLTNEQIKYLQQNGWHIE